jgi:hypothetical protein
MSLTSMKIHYDPTGWVAKENGITEYSKGIYLSVMRYWIGFKIRWAKNEYGQITISPFNSRICGIKYIDWGYFRVSIFKRNW